MFGRYIRYGLTMIMYLKEGLALSKKLSFVDGEIASMHRLSQRYQFLGEKEKERALTLEALDLAKKHDKKGWLGKVFEGVGNLFTGSSKFKGSLTGKQSQLLGDYLDALRLRRPRVSIDEIGGKLFSSIGLSYEKLDQKQRVHNPYPNLIA